MEAYMFFCKCVHESTITCMFPCIVLTFDPHWMDHGKGSIIRHVLINCPRSNRERSAQSARVREAPVEGFCFFSKIVASSEGKQPPSSAKKTVTFEYCKQQ